ncbi:hypothetical protein [Novosphingobium pentaromativorans]|uniref:Lipoprotein n=1 Tax=Novosphingobium pentaromativorans US6-1 TaxID=1088721 RepID=G6EI51_9SPHN|nr:hypothetical protein [Novosphingobium pentaromativorans]AIT78681.1 hypothetical protein JI59_02065 [Novosphingobium pentaromativorans US6-1]EHJ59039.1 hypothetical protein NSU_4022 [Novosphingobium pentaromativorans US6-1]
MKKVFKNCAMLALPLAALLAAGCSQGKAEAATESSTETAEDANTVPAAVHMQMSVDDALNEAMKDSLNTGQITMLKNMAHQVTVGERCEGFEVDQDRFAKEMNLIHYDEDGKQMDLTEAELNTLEKKALLGFGMAMGSQMAIAAFDVKSYCNAAEEERASLAKDDDSSTIWKTPA